MRPPVSPSVLLLASVLVSVVAVSVAATSPQQLRSSLVAGGYPHTATALAIFVSSDLRTALDVAYPRFWNYLFANPPAHDTESALRQFFNRYADAHLSEEQRRRGRDVLDAYFHKHHSMPLAAIVAIVAGSVLGLFLLVVALRWMCCRKVQREEEPTSNYSLHTQDRYAPLDI